MDIAPTAMGKIMFTQLVLISQSHLSVADQFSVEHGQAERLIVTKDLTTQFKKSTASSPFHSS